jgi:hypothetical protein
MRFLQNRLAFVAGIVVLHISPCWIVQSLQNEMAMLQCSPNKKRSNPVRPRSLAAGHSLPPSSICYVTRHLPV